MDNKYRKKNYFLTFLHPYNIRTPRQHIFCITLSFHSIPFLPLLLHAGYGDGQGSAQGIPNGGVS